MYINAPKIALLGGGTGSFTLLQKLKELTPNITAIVNMCDDGGSTGVLRDELGVLPSGDVRQCLVALSDSKDIRDAFSYRFSDGTLAGQSLGNIFLSALELRYGSFDKAIKVANEIFRVTGKVVPVSLDNHSLVMTDGETIIEGQSLIGHRRIKHPDAKLSLNPPAKINPEARQAILGADLVLIAPGNLYGSILPIFVVDGVAEALQKTNAKKVSVTNLVTKPGQTDEWHVVDYVKKIEEYIGEGQIDIVLYNNGELNPKLFRKYAYKNEFPVDCSSERFDEITASAIGADVISKEITFPDPHDKAIPRTYIRHDAEAVGKELMRIFHE